MDLAQYDYTTDKTYLEYKFISEGPKGQITKIVRYTKIVLDDQVFFNLGFGDEKEENGSFNDSTISNNNDRNRVLATVAATILDFIAHYPGFPIFAKGSTMARTRLYQMGIAANFTEVSKLFNIYGYQDDNWKPFRKNINYEAFLVVPK